MSVSKHFKRLFPCLLLLCTGLFPTAVVAGFPGLHSTRQVSDPRVQWTQFGPGSAGYNEATWYHPTDPNYVFSTPDMFNSYRSTDGGRSWHTVKDYDGGEASHERFDRVYNMDFSRQDENFGMAVNRLGLWVTRDKGASWQADLGNETNFWGGRLSAVGFDPTDDRIIYVGSGNFWDVKGNARTYTRPHGGAHPWLGVTGSQNPGKIWRSDDQGQSWTLINQGLPSRAEIGQIFVDPTQPETVYAATTYGLFKSENRGETWQSRNQGLDNGIIRDMDLFYDADTGQVILYVIDLVKWVPNQKQAEVLDTTGGIFRSMDGGESWEHISASLRLNLAELNNSSISFHFFRTRSLASWFGASETVLRSTYAVPEDISPLFNRLVVDPTNKNRIYVAHNPRHAISLPLDGVWMTEDGGSNWWNATRIGSGWSNDAWFWNQHPAPIDVDLTQTNMEFGHIRHNRLKGIEYSSHSGVRSLTVNSKGDVLIGFQQQLLLSQDQGRSWQQIDQVETSPGSNIWVGTGGSNMPGRFIHQDRRIPETPYFTTGEHGLWRVSSGSDGVAVTQLSEEAESPAAIAFHPHDVNVVYMLAFRQQHAGAFRKSSDGGATWKTISRPITSPGLCTHQYSLLIDPNDPNNIYFAVPRDIINDVRRQEGEAATGVYASNDGGYSWQVMNSGLPFTANVNRLAMDPRDPNVLYAAVLDSSVAGGLFRSEDGAEHWERVEIAAGIRQVTNVHVAVDGTIYAATGSANGELAAGGVWRSRDRGANWERIFPMPLVFSVTTADYDPDRILVNAGPGNAIGGLNPGVYLSEDGGDSWIKINTNLGQPARVFDVDFDIKRPEILWLTEFGGSFYQGIINDNLAQVYATEILSEPASLLAPASESTHLDPENILLTWKDVGASGYRVLVARDVKMEEIVLDQIVADAQLSVNRLHYGSEYYWTVGTLPGLPWHSSEVSDYQEYYQAVWSLDAPWHFSTMVASGIPSSPQISYTRSFLGQEVFLQWTPADWVNRYTVYRRKADGSGPMLMLAELDRDVRWFKDTQIEPGQTYVYQVGAENELGASVLSSPETIHVEPTRTIVHEEFSQEAFPESWRTMGAWSFGRTEDASWANLRALFPRATGHLRLADVCKTHYRLQVGFRVQEWGNMQFANIRLGASMVGANAYQVVYWPGASTFELARRIDGNSVTVASSTYSVALDRWYDLRLDVRGEEVTLFLDDDLLVAWSDPDPLPGGDLELFISNVDLDIGYIRIYE